MSAQDVGAACCRAKFLTGIYIVVPEFRVTSPKVNYIAAQLNLMYFSTLACMFEKARTDS